jgi:hypothetical protein
MQDGVAGSGCAVFHRERRRTGHSRIPGAKPAPIRKYSFNLDARSFVAYPSRSQHLELGWSRTDTRMIISVGKSLTGERFIDNSMTLAAASEAMEFRL